MPASSRKRNKGKDRKAKQAVKKEETGRLKMHGSWLSDVISERWGVSCDHELVPEINIVMMLSKERMLSHEHPVAKFMITFYTYWTEGLKTPADILIQTMKIHTQVCNNDIHREMIINIMIRIGTNMVLLDEAGALCMAQTVMALEHYDGENGSINGAIYNRDTAIKRLNLQPDRIGSRRDCLKFFRKRITCKCLKKLHLEARKELPKAGQCMNCEVVKDRLSLSVCSRCMVEHYCSKECQVADWPVHKPLCDHLVRCHSSLS